MGSEKTTLMVMDVSDRTGHHVHIYQSRQSWQQMAHCNGFPVTSSFYFQTPVTGSESDQGCRGGDQ